MANNALPIVLAAAAIATASLAHTSRAQSGSENPLLGDAGAIAEGRRLYRSRCYICHLSHGGRGPNLFATALNDEAFLQTAINGRNTMPAFGTMLTPDDIWAVHAYVKSTDHYE